MDSKSSKITSIILAVIALLFVLFGEVASVNSMFGKGSVSGIEALQSKQTLSLAFYLLYVMPIIACVVNITRSEKAPRIFAAVAMMIMPFFFSFQENHEYGKLLNLTPGWGCMVYIVLAVVLIIVAAVTKDDFDIPPVPNGDNIFQPSSPASQPLHTDEVRSYSPERLEEIISQPQLYNPQLVERCREEIKIRKDGQALMEQVQAFDNAKVNEILRNPANYSPAIIYCCQIDQSRRLQEQAERQRKAQEELIKRQEAEAEAKRQKRKALWKKYQWFVYGAIAIILIILMLMYLFSDGRYYSKGKDAYMDGDMESAIEYLNKVDENHQNYPSAQWMLYKAYLSKNDSAQAARSLLQAVDNIEWDDQPEAARQYCKHSLYEDFAPYIKTDLLKAANLMSTSSSQKIQLGAAELYHNQGLFDKAYSIFSEYSSKHPGSNRTAQIANGYLGLYYLYGLGDLSRDADMAQDLLAISADESLFMSHLLLVEMALMRSPNYELVEKWSQADNLTYIDIDPKLVKRVLKNLTSANKRHTVGEGWTYMDNGWSSYSYNNGNGEYKGEATGGILNRSAQGWGIFTSTITKDNGDYRMVNLGHFTTQGTHCPNNGEGIIIYYFPDNGEIMFETGNYVNDKMVSGSTWSNSTPFAIIQFLSIPF